MEENKEQQCPDTQTPEQPEEQGYVPRPAWQVWAAWLALIIFIGFVILQVVQIYHGFR